MFTRFKRTPSPIDVEIEALLEELKYHRQKAEDYKKFMDEVERLHKMKMQNASRRVSPDTALMTSAHLAGIVMILKHEQVNVITSKAMSFLPKMKA